MSSFCGCSTRRRSSFTFTTPAMFHDVESGREIYVDPAAAREDYLRRFAAHAAADRAIVRRPGHRVRADHDRPAARAGAVRPAESADAARPAPGPPDGAGTGRCSMSFLTPLYILGVAAVAAPIVFHLIRRVAQGRGAVQLAHVPVADPAPPDAAEPAGPLALAALASGRARPAGICVCQAVSARGGPVGFRRCRAAPDRPVDRHQCQHAPRRPLAAGQTLARQVLADCRPTDQLAVFAFDATCQPLFGFRESATLDPARREVDRQGGGRSPGTILGRDQPGPGPDRRRGGDRRRGRYEARKPPECRGGSS